MVRISGQSKQYGAELQEMLNLKRLFHNDSVDGTTAVETDESKMEFAPLPLEKKKRCESELAKLTIRIASSGGAPFA